MTDDQQSSNDQQPVTGQPRDEAARDQPSVKQSWSELGESFTSLGRVMRERYQVAGGATEGETAEETAAREEAALRRAFEQVTEAVRGLGERVAEVVRDDDVRGEARKTASSFDEALSNTVDMIAGQVSGLFRKSKASETPDDDRPV